MSISAEYDQHYMDNFNAMIEQEEQREQARRRKKEDLYSFFELHYVPEGDYTSKIYIGCDIPAKKDLYFSSLPDWHRRKLGCITCGFLYSE